MSDPELFQQRLVEVCSRRGWALAGGAADGSVEVKFEDGRRQTVGLEAFSFEGQQLVRLVTTIGSVERIKPERLTDALRLNYGLPHGALAVRKDALVMVDTLHWIEADASEIEASIRYLAETGDHFEKTMFGSDEH